MMAFFWVLWILAGLFVVTVVAHYLGGWLYARRLACLVTREKENKQKRFESQCWRAKLRRETEPTGIVEHELNGHHYIAVSHGIAEVPALYLSMRRMMMEVENEKIIGKGGKLTYEPTGEHVADIEKWTLTPRS